MKKIISLLLLMVMVMSIAGCGNKETKTDDQKDTTQTEDGQDSKDTTSTSDADDGKTTTQDVKISFLNTKAEIQAQLEEVAVKFKEETGIEVEIMPTGAGVSPFEKMTALYNSGNAPTISMMDVGDLEAFADTMLDLSGEKWVDDAMAGSLDVTKINDKLLAFPFAVEGFGLIYNKAAIEGATGETFDPAAIKTKADLEQLFMNIDNGGIAPIVISPLDWSLGAHYTQIAFSQKGVNIEGHNQVMSDLTSGSLTFRDFSAFESLMDTFDFLSEYNIDKDDPLSGTYDSGAEAVATGKAAFWFMGNWAWPQIDELNGDNDDFGFIPVPLDMDGEMNKISAGPTKYVAVDQSQSTDEEQQAALTFLNWLVYEQSGQEALAYTCGIIPAFTNIEIAPKDALAESIKEYIGNDQFYSMVLTFPSDYWSEVGAHFQEYMAGYSTRDEFYEKMETYWKNRK